jgi:hypothetical protein
MNAHRTLIEALSLAMASGWLLLCAFLGYAQRKGWTL